MRININIVLALILFSTGILQSQPASWNIEHVKTLWVTGCWQGFESDGEFIYASNSWGIMVYRFNPDEDEEPVLIGRYPTPGSSQGLFLQDTLLYICDWPNHLRIWSVADVNNLHEVGFCEDDVTQYHHIQIQGDYAYIIPEWLAHTRIGLRIISIEDPINPQIRGFVEYQNQDLSNLKISGNLAYITGVGPWPVRGGVHVVDIEDPNNPFELMYYGLDESNGSGGMEIFNDTLLVRTQDSLYVLSVSDPENIEIITTSVNDYDYAVITGKLFFRQGYLFTIAAGIRIVDFRNIFNPRFLGGVSGLGEGATLCNDYAFGGLGSSGWRSINVSNYRNPVIEYESTEKGSFQGIIKRGDYLFVIDRHDVRIPGEERNSVNRFRVFSIADIDNPVEVACLRFVGQYVDKLEIVDDIAYAAGGNTCLTAFDISDPENPRQYFRRIGIPNDDFVIRGDYAFVIGNGILVYSIAEPDSFRIVGTYHPYFEDERHTGDYYNLATMDNTLLISGRIPGQGYHLWTYDISNPMNLDSLGRCELPSITSSTDMVVVGDYTYICDWSGLHVITIADPRNPQPIWTDQSANVGSIDIFGGRLYCGSGEGIKIYSLDNPERPELVGIYDVPSGSCDIWVEDNLAYLAGGYDLTIYDISRSMGAWYVGLSEEYHDFGTVAVDSNADWELDISNMGRERCEITGVRVDSPHLRNPFSCNFRQPFSLDPGADTSFTITFRPDTSRVYAGTIHILSDELENWVTLSGTGIIPNAANEQSELPIQFGLEQPFPNPFNSTTTIRYQLPVNTSISLLIYDLNGRIVSELAAGAVNAGYHQAVWKADTPAGIYFYRLTADGYSETRKMVLVK